MNMNFEASRITLDYRDIASSALWDTARDVDGGVWRELWHSPGTQDELSTPSVKTQAPSTMLVIGRVGQIELIDATEPVSNIRQQGGKKYGPQFLNILGPLGETAVVEAHAAEGSVAARVGTAVYIFDLYLRTVYKWTTGGLYICKPPAEETWEERWETEVLTQISTQALAANATGRIRCSRAVASFSLPVIRAAQRPYIFVESGAYVSALTPELKAVRWTHSGWTNVYNLDVLPRGEIIFGGGTSLNAAKSVLLKPDNWLWPAGSDTVLSNSPMTFGSDGSIIVPNGSLVGPGNNEVGVRLRTSGVDDGTTLITDLDPVLGGQRIISEGSFGLKTPGYALLMVAAGETTPETDTFKGTADFTKTGTLTATALKGRTYWGGWGTGNYLAANYAGGSILLATQTMLNGSWAISGEIIRTGTSDDDVILEFAYAPSGYTGDAFKLYVENDILKFVSSQNGYGASDASIVPMTGTLPLNKPVPFILGYDDGIFYLIADGQRGTAAGTIISNSQGVFRIGLGVDGAKPCNNLKLSSFTFAKGGRLKAADDCAGENIRTMGEVNDVTIDGAYFNLVGGDDEFDSYTITSDTMLYKVQGGEIISETELRNIGLGGVTDIEFSVRGWRIAANFDKDDYLNARLQGSNISFDRSEYERMLTQPGRKAKDDMRIEFSTAASVDKVGPRLTCAPRRQEIYEIDAIVVQNTGVIRRINGILILRRLESGDAVATISVTGAGNSIASTNITFTATADGGYLTFVSSSSPLDWIARINRIK